jgi:hypothetical protein
LDEELHRIFPHHSTNPGAEMIHFPGASSDVLVMMRPIRLPTMAI